MNSRQDPFSRSPVRRVLGSIGKVLLFAYVSILLLMMFFETYLVYPRPNPQDGDWNPVGLAYQDVWLDTRDGTKLHGWLLEHESPQSNILFFHGNGEHVAWCGPDMAQWRDALRANVLVMDYRGYGKSGGKPSESAIIADAIQSADWLADHAGVATTDLVLWGRSIGGGVVAGVAASKPPKAIVIESSFHSLSDVAASHYPWLPVRWLMRNHYPSAERLANYQGKYLQWHGDRDRVVSLESARTLFDAVPSNDKTFLLGQDIGHNGPAPASFEAAVRSMFLNELH